MEHEDRAISESARTNRWRAYSAKAWNNERGGLLGGCSLTFWTHCVEKYGGPILDVGCGNGRFSIPLAAHGTGHRVVGVDINEGLVASADRMLQQINESVRAGHSIGDPVEATEKTVSEYRRLTERLIADEREIDATFLVGDIVRLNLDVRFQLAVMTSYTWTVLQTQEDQIALLERLHEHLLPGGAFAVNMPLPYYFLHERAPDADERSRRYDPVSQVFEHNDPAEGHLPIRLTNLPELELLFRLTGFEIVETYADADDMRPFTGVCSDDYTVVAARR